MKELKEVKKSNLLPELQEKIDAWKKDNDSDFVYEVIISHPEGDKVYFLSDPDDMTYSQAMGLMSSRLIVKAGELLLTNCYLGGEPLPTKAERTLYRTVCIESTKTIEFFDTKIVKH